jgi:hypothetical protein
MSGWYWLSTERMTIGAEVRDGLIVNAAPIARKFIGQPSKNLGTWLRNQGGFMAERISA